MLTIPFLSNYIQKFVQKQLVSDSVDYLNYYFTSLLLAFFSLAISCKQYFGSPIQCWVPKEFRGGWEQYVEDYCFISNFYHVPMDKDDIETTDHGDHISYYRWVPIVLALQAVGFYLPNYIWSHFQKRTAINPGQFIEEASKISNLSGEVREKEIAALDDVFLEQVSAFGSQPISKTRVMMRSGWNATGLYLLIKLLYVLNLVGQLILLNNFFNGQFFNWGYESIEHLANGRDWTEDDLFPRVIFCDFSIRRMGNMAHYTVQCVIMMNMINEKLYLFLFLWFSFLIVLSSASFFYYLVNLGLPALRRRFVSAQIDEKASRKQNSRFVSECLHPDGVLLLSFIKEHASDRVVRELTLNLLAKFEDRAKTDGVSNMECGGDPNGNFERSSDVRASTRTAVVPITEQPYPCWESAPKTTSV